MQVGGKSAPHSRNAHLLHAAFSTLAHPRPGESRTRSPSTHSLDSSNVALAPLSSHPQATQQQHPPTPPSSSPRFRLNPALKSDPLAAVASSRMAFTVLPCAELSCVFLRRPRCSSRNNKGRLLRGNNIFSTPRNSQFPIVSHAALCLA